MKAKLLIILMSMFLLAAAFVSAASPFLTQAGGTLTIQAPELPYYLPNANGFDAYWHVFNSTGSIVTAPAYNCTIHIYNESALHVLEANAVMEGSDYEVVFGTNITNIPGEYGFIIWCADGPGREAGFVSGGFTIGYSDTDPQYYLPLAIAAGIMIFAMLYVGFALDKEHVGLKLFMIWLGTILLTVVMQFSSNISRLHLMHKDVLGLFNTFSYVSIFVALITSALLFVYVLQKILLFFSSTKKKENPHRGQ